MANNGNKQQVVSTACLISNPNRSLTHRKQRSLHNSQSTKSLRQRSEIDLVRRGLLWACFLRSPPDHAPQVDSQPWSQSIVESRVITCFLVTTDADGWLSKTLLVGRHIRSSTPDQSQSANSIAFTLKLSPVLGRVS